MPNSSMIRVKVIPNYPGMDPGFCKGGSYVKRCGGFALLILYHFS